MKLKAILLTIMVLYPFSLELSKLFNSLTEYVPTITFPILWVITANIFWTVYFGITVILAFLLIFSGVTIKTTNIIHNHPIEPKALVAEPKSEEVKKIKEAVNEN